MRKRRNHSYRINKNGNDSNTGGPRGRSRKHGAPSRHQQNGHNRKKLVSDLDPESLIQKSAPKKQKAFTPSRTFAEMPLDDRLKAAIRKKGFTHPTEIQDRTLEPLLEGRDLMGIAQTGTGKTGAFLIPLIHNLLNSERRFQTLIVVPTRELALQVKEEFESLTKGMGFRSVCFIGGTNVNSDVHKARKHNDFVIATTGRLLDLVQRGVPDLRTFEVLILDEFDRMLDMGFLPDVKRIVKAMEMRRQTLLFSATADPKQQPIVDKILRNPLEVRVSSGVATAEHVDQDIIRVPDGESKMTMLKRMLKQDEFEKVLLFVETKRKVHRVCMQLKRAGVNADQIHGDKSQAYRQKALNKFRDGRLQVLVATDVAARGLDVEDVTHVINFQLPRTMDSYIHRVGRTGRAGKAGKAYTFVD